MRIKPRLTPLAATGLGTIMLLAAIFHTVRAEYAPIGFNLVMGALIMVIAWGKWKKAPIAARHVTVVL